MGAWVISSAPGSGNPHGREVAYSYIMSRIDRPNSPDEDGLFHDLTRHGFRNAIQRNSHRCNPVVRFAPSAILTRSLMGYYPRQTPNKQGKQPAFALLVSLQKLLRITPLARSDAVYFLLRRLGPL